MRRFIRAILATVTLALTVGVVPGFVPGATPQANAGVVGPDLGDTMGFRADQTAAAVYYPARTNQDSSTQAIDVDADGNVYSATNWAGGGELGVGTHSDWHTKYKNKPNFTRPIIHKVNANGEHVWSWELHGKGYDGSGTSTSGKSYDHFNGTKSISLVANSYGSLLDIVVDDDGNTYATGFWYGQGVYPEDVPTENTSVSIHAKNKSDGFVVSLDPDGNTRWIKALHSKGQSGFSKHGWSYIDAVDVDNKGNVVVLGRFVGLAGLNMDDEANPTVGNSNAKTTKVSSPYVAKLNASDGTTKWFHHWNTCANRVWQESSAYDVKFASNGSIMVVGAYNTVPIYDCDDRSLDGELSQDGNTQTSLLYSQRGSRSNLVKISWDGKFVWGREFGSKTNVNAAVRLAVHPTNGDLFIVGTWEQWNKNDDDHVMSPSVPANAASYPGVTFTQDLSIKMAPLDHEAQGPWLSGHGCPKGGDCPIGVQKNADTYVLHTDRNGNHKNHETYDVHLEKDWRPSIDISSDGSELAITNTAYRHSHNAVNGVRHEASGWVMAVDSTSLAPKWTTIAEPLGASSPSSGQIPSLSQYRDAQYGPNDNIYVGGNWWHRVSFGQTAAGESVESHPSDVKSKADAVVIRYNTEGNVAGLTVPPLPAAARLGYGIVTEPTLPESGFSSVVNGTTPNDGSLGFTVAQSDGSTVVAETGTTDTFTVVLKAQPPSDAQIFLCLCHVIGEVSLDKTTLTFTSSNWDEPQTVTVTGIDEDVDDGNSGSLVTLTTVNGTSAEWSDVPNQTFMVTNVDNDVLAPGAEVIWNEPLCKGGRWEVTPQPGIAVRQYMILKDDLSAASPPSSGFTFGGPPVDVVAEWVRANHNNGIRTVPNYNILWQDGFLLDEDGGTSTWPETFKLRGWDVGVTDLDDASDRPVGFYFRNGVFTYNTNSSVTVFPTSYGPSSEVSGHSWDLDLYDTYLAFAHPEGSTNHQIYPQFEQKGCEPGPFVLCSGTSFDCDDTYGFTVSKDDVTTTEEGGSESFTVCLTGPTYMGFDGPSADVVMSVENTDSTEVELSTDSLVFTPDNWDDCQTITVTGVDDGDPDGDATSYVNIVIDHDDSSYEYAAIPNDFVTVLNENVDLLPPAPNPDIDGDGIINEDEVDGCVDKADCDGDGINDGNEIFACMLAADCDGDGVGDNEEISQACIQDPSCTETINNPVDDLPVVVDPDPVDPDPQDPPDEPVIDTPDEIDDPQDPLDLLPDDQEDPDDQEETDDLPTDTDGDGVPDDDEAAGCAETVDCDNDGIEDGEDSDPTNPDRDNDGLADGSDPDPTNPDSDGDGIPDGQDSDVDGDGVVDCPECDTDGDGIADGNDPDNGDLVNPGGSIPGIEPDAGPDEPAPPSDTDDTDDEAPLPVQTPDAKSPGRGLADQLGDLPLAAVAAAAALAIAAATAAAASLAGPSLLSWLFRGSLGVWLFGLLFGRRGVRCSSCDLKLVKQAGLWVDKDTEWVVGINNHTHVPADFSDKDRDKYVTAVQQILQRRDP